MGGAASRTKAPAEAPVCDFVVSVLGEHGYARVTTVTLSPGDTLEAARREIEMDAAGGVPGLPRHFLFVLLDTPVAPRKEKGRRIRDSLKDGGLRIMATDAPGNEEVGASEQRDDEPRPDPDRRFEDRGWDGEQRMTSI